MATKQSNPYNLTQGRRQCKTISKYPKTSHVTLQTPGVPREDDNELLVNSGAWVDHEIST